MDSSSIEIIGGADGPTAIFVATRVSPAAVTLTAAVVAGAAVLLWLWLRRRNKNK